MDSETTKENDDRPVVTDEGSEYLQWSAAFQAQGQQLGSSEKSVSQQSSIPSVQPVLLSRPQPPPAGVAPPQPPPRPPPPPPSSSSLPVALSRSGQETLRAAPVRSAAGGWSQYACPSYSPPAYGGGVNPPSVSQRFAAGVATSSPASQFQQPVPTGAVGFRQVAPVASSLQGATLPKSTSSSTVQAEAARRAPPTTPPPGGVQQTIRPEGLRPRTRWAGGDSRRFPRGRPRLNFSALPNRFPNPTTSSAGAQLPPASSSSQPPPPLILGTSSACGPSQQQCVPLPSISTLVSGPLQDLTLSPSTPAFIDTDFTKDLFAEAELHWAKLRTSSSPLPDLSQIMDLSSAGELAITSPSPQPQSQNPIQSQLQNQAKPFPLLARPSSEVHSPANSTPTKMETQTHALVGQNLLVSHCPLPQSQQQQPQQQQQQQQQPQLLTINQSQFPSTQTTQAKLVQAPRPPLHGSLPQQPQPPQPPHPSLPPTVALCQANQQQSRVSTTCPPQAQLAAQFSQLAQVRLSAAPAPSVAQAAPTVPLSQAQLPANRTLSPAQALSLLRPRQAVGLSLTSAQTILGQTQAGTVVTSSHPQATIINVNPSLTGARFISQPIQMLSSPQQVVSMPIQLTAAQGGQTVLMPIQQPASVIHPANMQHVLTAPGLNKTLQTRPATVLTVPSQQVQQLAKAKTGTTGGLGTLASPVVSSATGIRACSLPAGALTIPVASLGMVSTAQQPTGQLGHTTRMAAPTLPTQQVLNIPRLQLARPAGPTGLTAGGEPRHTIVLQQPLRSPDRSTGSTLQQIRPREIQPMRPPEAKIVAIQPQAHLQVLHPGQVAGAQMGGTVILTQPTSISSQSPTAMGAQQTAGSPSCIPVKSSSDDRPLNLDTKTSIASASGVGATVASLATPLQAQTMAMTSTSSDKKSPALLTKSPTRPTPRVDEVPLPASTTPQSEVKTEALPSTTKIHTPEESTPAECEDPDFVWEDYLEETGSVAVPDDSFRHVECSLRSGIQKGMKVEVTRAVPPDCYWLATIVMTCGPLLRLRYDGHDDGAADFWLDVGSGDVHAVGWAVANGRRAHPPEGLKDTIENWSNFITNQLAGASSVPEYLLDSDHGVTPIDQIKPGQRLEVQHELASTSVWVVRIMENVGGRLLLRYEGTDRAAHDFWLFYLHHRLHPIGWAKQNDSIYKPPEVILSERQNYTEWSEIRQAALAEAATNTPPAAIFADQEEIGQHEFKVGWKLEALHPDHCFQICPSTVVSVAGRFFVVEIDSVVPAEAGSKKVQFCCHRGSPNIFPMYWCRSKGLRLTPPTGWEKPEFNWEDYLQECNTVAAPESAFNLACPEHGFTRGMKMEAVNPSQPGQICAASITRIIDHLMWIHLDSCTKIVANHIVPVTSQDIFPVGWCASNNYPLKPPRMAKKVAVVQPERADGLMSADEYRNATYSQIKAGDGGSSWCPKIYFNHKCFSGPFLSKGRIAELPRCVGPGPIPLVLGEVLTMLINVAYKSSRVLRELQLEGIPNPEMQSQTLKAKYKGKSYCALVEMCRTTSQIEQYCRQVCIKLECCPNLFSPNFVNGNCPENCSQLTKTKYTYYYGKKKKRKIGRPPGGHSNLENGPTKMGKRRKKRMNLLIKKKSTPVEHTVCQNGDNDDVFEDDKSSRSTDTLSSLGANDQDADFRPHHRPQNTVVPPRKKRKYEHKIPPPSIIKTRGAKLPRYSFERRTHMKIMVLPPPHGRHRTSASALSASAAAALPATSDGTAADGLEQANSATDSAVVLSPTKEPLYKEDDILQLDSNPLYWSVIDVVRFIKTTDCAHLARFFRDQAIDGQALLLLTLPTIQDHLDLKLGPAIKLCHHIERVKIAFYEQFAK